jgi:hypothetical protein
MKRISFTKYDLGHIYEMCLEDFCVDDCSECDYIKLRMEKFLGEKDTKAIKEIIKKHPYHNDKINHKK